MDVSSRPQEQVRQLENYILGAAHKHSSRNYRNEAPLGIFASVLTSTFASA